MALQPNADSRSSTCRHIDANVAQELSGSVLRACFLSCIWFAGIGFAGIGFAGCASEPVPVLYARALRAEDGAAGWTLCGAIGGEADRGDCQAAVSARFSYFDRCADAATKKWQDECWFEAAESQSRAGDTLGALSACSKGSYVKECQDHLLGMLAMGWIDEPVAAVGAHFSTIKPKLEDRTLPFLFWRHFFRNRIGRAQSFVAGECPDATCASAAGAEITSLLRQSPAVCTALPDYVWAGDPTTRQAVEDAKDRICIRQPADGGVWKAPGPGKR